MKLFQIVIASVLAGTFSMSAMAAKEITREEAEKSNYVSLGTVQVSSEPVAPNSTKADLSKLADEKGGSYYVIIAADNDRQISATAEVFKPSEE